MDERQGGIDFCSIWRWEFPRWLLLFGVNKEIIQEGINGFCASTEYEWMAKLSLLIENSVLRRKMGENGRRIVEKHYSFESSIPKLMLAVKKVYSGEY